MIKEWLLRTSVAMREKQWLKPRAHSAQVTPQWVGRSHDELLRTVKENQRQRMKAVAAGMTIADFVSEQLVLSRRFNACEPYFFQGELVEGLSQLRSGRRTVMVHEIPLFDRAPIKNV